MSNPDSVGLIPLNSLQRSDGMMYLLPKKTSVRFIDLYIGLLSFDYFNQKVMNHR